MEGDDVTGNREDDDTLKNGDDVTLKEGDDVTPNRRDDVTAKRRDDVTLKKGDDVTPERKDDVTPKRKDDVTPTLSITLGHESHRLATIPQQALNVRDEYGPKQPKSLQGNGWKRFNLILDIGASTNLAPRQMEPYMQKKEKSLLMVNSYKEGEADPGKMRGTLHMYAMSHTAQELGATISREYDTMDNISQSLMSAGDMCELEGYKILLGGSTKTSKVYLEDKVTKEIIMSVPVEYIPRHKAWIVRVVVATSSELATKIGRAFETEYQKFRRNKQAEANMITISNIPRVVEHCKKNGAQCRWVDGDPRHEWSLVGEISRLQDLQTEHPINTHTHARAAKQPIVDRDVYLETLHPPLIVTNTALAHDIRTNPQVQEL